MTKEQNMRSEWRDPWLMASAVAYVAFWLTVAGVLIYKTWTP